MRMEILSSCLTAKFYEFNPAVTYGEPGGPVSYVAEGYHVVEFVEDGKKVYEVVKN